MLQKGYFGVAVYTTMQANKVTVIACMNVCNQLITFLYNHKEAESID